ncbi:MAG: EAL domain-containing protein [Myxococcota bacterium]|nr:EAL domain-containing protein [Myxococcota bacterium]
MTQESQIFVGRQPILDRDQNVIAYELLFRASAAADAAVYAEQGAASLRVIVNTFMTMGLDRVLGNHLGFLNVVGSMVKSDLIEALPRERVVIEVLENVEIDEELTARCSELDEMGYAIALDDWIQDDYRAEMVSIARYIKLDLMEIPRVRWRSVVRKLRKHDVILLAEKVETREAFEYCLSLGFDLFQGYFFSTPQILEGENADPARLEVLTLIQKLVTGEENAEIAEVLKRNPSLSMNLLRLVNSAALSPVSKIARIEDAVVYLGRDNLRRWLFMLLYAGGDEDALQDPLLQTATHRGCVMELVAEELVEGGVTPTQASSAFLVGMLSMIDVLLGQPIEEIIPGLNLSDEVQAALLKHEGVLGRLFDLALQIERAEFDTIAQTTAELGLEVASLQDCDNRAYAWVNGLSQPAG